MDERLIRRAKYAISAMERAREDPRELISRAMRELAHRQHQTEDPERRREIMAAAGRVSWAKLSKEEQDARVARMHEGRRRWLEGRRHAT